MSLSPDRALQSLLGSFDRRAGAEKMNLAIQRAGEGSVLAAVAMAAVPRDKRFAVLTGLFEDERQARSVLAVAGNVANRQGGNPMTAFQASAGLHLLVGELMRETGRMQRHPLAIAAGKARQAVQEIRAQGSERASVGVAVARREAHVATTLTPSQVELQRVQRELRERASRPAESVPGAVLFVDHGGVRRLAVYMLRTPEEIKRADPDGTGDLINGMGTDGHGNYYTFRNIGEFSSVARKIKAESGRDLRTVPAGTIVKAGEREVLSTAELRKGVLRFVTAERAEEIRLEVQESSRRAEARRRRKTSWWRIDVWIEKGARALYDAGRDVVNAAGQIARAIANGDLNGVIAALAGIGSIIADLMFGAMEILLSWMPGGIGHQIVTVIRTIFDVMLSMATEGARALVLMLLSIGKFFARLAQGDPIGAIRELLGGVTRVLIAPMMSVLGSVSGIPKDKIGQVIDRIVDANPMLPLDLVSLVLGGLTGAADQVINKVITIAKPLILAILEYVVRASDKLRKAVDIGLTAILFVVNRIGTIAEMAKTIVGKLQAPGGPSGPALEEIVKQALDGAWDALKNFNIAGFFAALGRMVERAGDVDYDKALRTINVPPVESLLRLTDEEMRKALDGITPAQRAELVRRLAAIQRGEDPLSGPLALAQQARSDPLALVREAMRNPAALAQIPDVGPALAAAARRGPAAMRQALDNLTSAQRAEVMRRLGAASGELALAREALSNPEALSRIPSVGPALAAAARNGPQIIQRAVQGDPVAREALEQVNRAALEGDPSAEAAWDVLRGLVMGNQRPAQAPPTVQDARQAAQAPTRRLSLYERGMMAGLPAT